MKQAIKVVEEIERLKGAIYKTNSEHLIKDYSKQTVKLIKELKTYCKYKNLNFNEVMRGAK
jgi:hypothetical protein